MQSIELTFWRRRRKCIFLNSDRNIWKIFGGVLRSVTTLNVAHVETKFAKKFNGLRRRQKEKFLHYSTADTQLNLNEIRTPGDVAPFQLTRRGR